MGVPAKLHRQFEGSIGNLSGVHSRKANSSWVTVPVIPYKAKMPLITVSQIPNFNVPKLRLNGKE